ncbi:MAG: L,D-transpeptidase [Chthoniobacter sp.]|uniref:L,D-transpeptidase n=1 Tax=Chthoniobacter sp. TaxID=2510640 RepID=UPI0032A693D7
MSRALLAVCLFASIAAAEEVVPYVPTVSIVISVPEQKLLVLRDGCLWKKYPISTSKFGVGDSYGSYKTPVGQLRVCEKIGEELASGSVIKQRHATGEVLPANSPGRDPIVTRILWLDGLEEQNHNARSRGIYIHGTTEEGKIGKPVSYGCIRMRSPDVLEVFEEATIDTPVSIISDKLPKYAKYTPPKPKVIAVVAPPKPAPTAAKPAASTPPPAIASAATNSPKKIAGAAPAPPPVAEYHPPTVDSSSHSSVTVSAVSNSVVAHAMQGSMLSAGLPDGPKIPTLPEPPAPKDVTRFGQLGPNPVHEKGLSLQDPALNVTPAIQAADAQANAHATAAKDQESADSTAKPASPIAFRAGNAGNKSKQ